MKHKEKNDYFIHKKLFKTIANYVKTATFAPAIERES